MSIQFEDVAAAALAEAPLLLSEWLGGGRKGHEWLGERKANGGPGDSWSVNLKTGLWAHFGGSGPQSKGGDLISLYAALHHIDQLPALEAVAKLVGVSDRARKPRVLKKIPPEPKAEPIPEDAPPLPLHSDSGAPTAVYAYGSAFRVARFDISPTKKSFLQYTWRRGGWHNSGYGSNKPLYRVEELAANPQAPVLIVEGEKCAELAAQTLRRYVAISWAGGAGAVMQSDWSPLAGRDVIIWPDADDTGRAAAGKIAEIIAASASRVRVVQPNGQPNGWDIADALSDGWTPKQIATWAAEHIVTTIDAKTEPPAPNKDVLAPPTAVPGEFLPAAERQRDEDYPDGQPQRSCIVAWKNMGLATDSKDVPFATLSNTSLILREHEKFKGKIWWDNFCERIYHSIDSPVPKEWNDIDSTRVTAFIQQSLSLPKINLKTVQEAIAHAAHENEINSVQDWLNSLQWDGVPRLQAWVGDCLGVELNPYSMAVSRNWVISMVARAFVPGIQVDTMPVLEGMQGEGKSSALEIIGGRWFAAVGTAFGSQEFIQTIQGKWLIEIPDMSGFSRRDHSNVISTITTRTDRYRMKYGRFDQDHPRKCVFAATSETDDYLPEMRGFRRYWPLRCKGIDLNALRMQREQIFAEAVKAYKSGAPFHQMPVEDTSHEQRARNTEDLWTEDVLSYCESRGLAGQAVHAAKILTDSAIQMRHSELDHQSKLRVTNILKAYGWVPKTIENIRQYVKPRRKD